MKMTVPNRDPAPVMEDVRNRTLAFLPNEVAKLVCLSSLRDYNTGEYLHDGLYFRHGPEAIDAALRALHSEVFRSLVVAPLATLTNQLADFFQLSCPDQAKAIEVWRDQEPYRSAVPRNSDSVSRELFFSNVRTALAILEGRQTLGRACGVQ